MEARVNTNVVANPMPIAVSIFLEVPINGHNPKNFTSTKLLTSIVPVSKWVYFIIGHVLGKVTLMALTVNLQ